MQLFQILVNNKPIRIGNPLPPTVFSLTITCMARIPVNPAETPMIKNWLNNLVDKLSCEYVEYNKVLIHKSDIKKF